MKKTYSNAQWSLGWGKEKVSQNKSTASTFLCDNLVKKYHNGSQVEMKEKFDHALERENKEVSKMRNTSEFFNKKLPNFDPKTAGKSSVVFGLDAIDYRSKDKVFVNSNRL